MVETSPGHWIRSGFHPGFLGHTDQILRILRKSPDSVTHTMQNMAVSWFFMVNAGKYTSPMDAMHGLWVAPYVWTAFFRCPPVGNCSTSNPSRPPRSPRWALQLAQASWAQLARLLWWQCLRARSRPGSGKKGHFWKRGKRWGLCLTHTIHVWYIYLH